MEPEIKKNIAHCLFHYILYIHTTQWLLIKIVHLFVVIVNYAVHRISTYALSKAKAQHEMPIHL